MNARSLSSVTAAALLAALSMTAPAAARAAGTYTVQSCRDAAGAALPAHAWLGDQKDQGALDRCPDGGALEVSAGAGDDVSAFRFAAAPGTRIAGYRIHLTAVTAKAPDWLRAEAGTGEGSALELPPVSAGCLAPGCWFGDEDDPLSEQNLVTAGGIAAPALALVARCGVTCDPWWSDGRDHDGFAPVGPVARARLWSSAVELADEHSPVLGAAAGSLLSGAAISGRASVTALATDLGGGVASVALLVDGVVRARATSCAEPFTLPAPCPAALPASLELDTATLEDGQHTATLVATDAAGNSATSGPLAFRSANSLSPPGSATSAGDEAGAGGAPAAAPPTALLRAELELDRRQFTLPARGRRITGIVLRSGGAPAAGARLVLRSRRFGVGAPRARTVRELRTGADGRFSIALPLVPRRLVVELDDDAYRAAASDEIRVLGRLRIGVKTVGKGLRNGSTMLLLAQIAGAGGDGAAADRTLLVQALVDGRWNTVDSVETAAKGTASWRYRFRATTRLTRYLFRVRVPRGGDDWPWPATSSRAVSVLVKP